MPHGIIIIIILCLAPKHLVSVYSSSSVVRRRNQVLELGLILGRLVFKTMQSSNASLSSRRQGAHLGGGVTLANITWELSQSYHHTTPSSPFSQDHFLSLFCAVPHLKKKKLKMAEGGSMISLYWYSATVLARSKEKNGVGSHQHPQRPHLWCHCEAGVQRGKDGTQQAWGEHRPQMHTPFPMP